MQSIRKNNSTKSILNAVSGITLIALVVTIVVLLILASVSITVVFGDNGILEMAKQAKESQQTANAKEMVEMQVFGSYDKTGSINMNTLNDNLMNKLGNVYFRGKILSDTNKIEELPVVVTYNDVEVKIGDGSGKFSNIITANNYGDRVKYNANGVDDWKIFYNNGNVFLISSDIIPNDKIANSKITKDGNYRAYITDMGLEGGNNLISNNVAQKFLWNYKFKYTEFNYANTRFLSLIPLNTEIWSNFVDENYAEIAIGAPTLEMWMESWNEKYPNDLLYYQISDDVGYKISSDNKNFGKSISETIIQAKDGWKYNRENNGDNLYFPRASYFKDGEANCHGYYLATNMWEDKSLEGYENGIGLVDFSGLIHSGNWFGKQAAFRPVVCLKSSVKASMGTDGVWILEE